MARPVEVIDAEEAVVRAFHRERIMTAVGQAGGVRALLATYRTGRAELAPVYRPGYHGHDGTRTMADGGAVDTSPVYGSAGWRVSAFAVAVLAAVWDLAEERRVLVVRHGMAATRPDWGEHLPAVAETVEPVGLDGTRYRRPVYNPGVRHSELGGPDGHEDVAYSRGGPEAIARARQTWTDWWDGLSDVAFGLGGQDIGVSVLGPVALREPWIEGLRFPGRGNRLLDGPRRAEFAELAAKGMKPLELAKRFTPLTPQQAGNLKKKMVASGEIVPVDNGAKT